MIYSYSFLSALDQCPRKAQHKFVLRDVPKEDTPALAYGRRTHEVFEHRLKEGKWPAGHDFNPAKWEPFALALDPRHPHVEVPLAMTINGRGCGFWDPNAFLRGKVDVAVTSGEKCLIIDWKTGKPREDPLELEIFSLLIKANNSDLSSFTGRYVWLKELRVGKEHVVSPVRAWDYVKRRDEQVKGLERQGGEWPANPTGLCPWCPVKTCEHWREK